jgi:pseudaminic acid synthase
MNAFIAAELSANHGGDIDIAKKTILAAKDAGADAVKIQTLRPELITLDCDNEYFRVDTGTIWDGTTLFELYSNTFLPWEWHKELFDFAREHGIVLFSSPFDDKAVDLLEECGNPIYKIASFEITDIPLIKYAASKGKPMIISCGIATLEEIEDAVAACREVGNEDITLLKCTSEYPAKIEDANLLTIGDMRTRFGVKVGLSDHTEGWLLPALAAAFEVTMIEKHFILSKDIQSADASFSMLPEDFASMVKAVRTAEAALGEAAYEIDAKKEKSRKYRRSLFVAEDVQKGDAVTKENVRSVRPGYGMPPKYFDEVLGRTFNADYKAGTPLAEELLDK